MVIDFHVHCFPDDMADKTITTLAGAAGIPPMSDGTVGGIKASMEKAGIDKSVILGIATRPKHCRKITQWSSSIQDENIIAFGSIHPECGEWEAELKAMKEAGLKGVKFHPDYQNFFVDDQRMYQVYNKAAEMGFVMIFHAGVDLGMPKPYHCTPDRMKRVVRAFSGAKIIAAHMGGFEYWDDVERCLIGEDLYLDTSYSLHKMDREQFVRMVDRHGYERVLFATDSPWGDQSNEVKRLRSMPLTDDAKNAIMGVNAAKLLGLTC